MAALAGGAADEWYHYDEDAEEQRGPFTRKELKKEFQEGRVEANSLIWNPDLHESWIELQSDGELLQSFQRRAPAPLKVARPAARRGEAKVPRPSSTRKNSSRGRGIKSTRSFREGSNARSRGGSRSRGSGRYQRSVQQVGWRELRTTDGVPYYHNAETGALSYDKPDCLKSVDDVADDGSWVWFPDASEGYVLAQVVQRKATGRVKVSVNGQTRTTKRGQQVYPVALSSLDRIESDLVLLDSLDPGLIMHNLKQRYAKSEIYTNIGTILISLNPYKRLPLYSTSKIEAYHRRGNRDLAPHVFEIADRCYKALTLHGEPQSILVSGESGAGKTEATKQVLNFIAEVAGSVTDNIEQQILCANPILEAFGNAKTLRNDNSSRFGRFTMVTFDSAGRIQGASIQDYLLEKSRVVFQQGGERNYHVFYQICTSEEFSKRFCLEGASSFRYASGGNTLTVDGIDDSREHEDCYNAMVSLGFAADEIAWIYSLVAAVLHLGNITFESDGGEGSCITDDYALQCAASLLGVPADLLGQRLVSREVTIHGDVITVALKPSDADDGCGALAKDVYGKLFRHIVGRINETLQRGADTNSIVGILDIFGFEIFENNMFEQMCINFANEKLQQLFNRHTFKLEEDVYASEGIQFTHIEFEDNQPIVDLIEGRRPPGILRMADDEIRTPGCTDARFVSKVDRQHKNHKYFIGTERSLRGKLCFTVLHYAGKVVYNCDQFLAKTSDRLLYDLYDVMSGHCSDDLTCSLFPRLERDELSRVATLGSKFRTQLRKLMGRLESTTPNYIRCIKPNPHKLGCGDDGSYDAPMVLDQLRNAGVFEAVKIRKTGFPFRLKYEQFAERFRCLLLDGENRLLPVNSSASARDKCERILKHTRQNFSEIRRGKTMLLYRAEQHRLLSLLRNLAEEKLCTKIQVVARGYIVRHGYMTRLRQALPILKRALREPTLEILDNAMAEAMAIMGPWASMGGNFEDSAILRHCRRLRTALVEWERLADLFEVVLQQDLGDDAHFESLFRTILEAEKVSDVVPTSWHQQLYDTATQAFEDWRAYRLNPALELAMAELERKTMRAVFDECHRLRFEDPRLAEIQQLLGISDSELLKRQYKRAVELHNVGRAVDREIKLKEHHLAQHGSVLQWQDVPQLRTSTAFANAKMVSFKREKIAAGMLVFSKRVMPTSLSRISQKPLIRHALHIFKAVTGYMGDRKASHPEELASEIVALALEHESLIVEVFLQIMKQLTENPTQSSEARGWDLLGFLLMHVGPPSSFENYLQMFVRRSAPQPLDFIARIYQRMYEGNVAAPPAPHMVQQLLLQFRDPACAEKYAAHAAEMLQ